MHTENRSRRGRRALRPRWWILYLILLGAGVVLWLEARTRMSAGNREAALIVLLLLVGALIEIWLSANRLALLYWSPREEPDRAVEHWNSFVATRRPLRPVLDQAPVTGALLQAIERGADGGPREPMPAPLLTGAGSE